MWLQVFPFQSITHFIHSTEQNKSLIPLPVNANKIKKTQLLLFVNDVLCLDVKVQLVNI